MKNSIKAVLEELYWNAHATGIQKNMPNDEIRIYSALNSLATIVEKEKIPRAGDDWGDGWCACCDHLVKLIKGKE